MEFLFLGYLERNAKVAGHTGMLCHCLAV